MNYRNARELNDFLAFLAITTAGLLGVVAVFGRILDRLLRRQSPTPKFNHNPEGHRP